jgi:hypothetical protein
MPTAHSKVRKFIRKAPVVLTEFHFFIWCLVGTIFVVYEAVKFLWERMR